jgi:hypothetical protein
MCIFIRQKNKIELKYYNKININSICYHYKDKI